jgi:hypothetical protein
MAWKLLEIMATYEVPPLAAGAGKPVIHEVGGGKACFRIP